MTNIFKFESKQPNHLFAKLPPPMLQLINTTKIYGQLKAANRVNLTIAKGEFFCLLGPSGCGKTTVLRLIAGFEKVSEGQIILNGKDITNAPPNKRDVNTVFQNYALFPNLNVNDNIAYSLMIRKVPAQEQAERVNEVIRLVGLQGFEKRMPATMSGGQQQRVALARALINRPQVLLLDEPLSALDKKIAEQTRHELIALQKKVGITFVFVTHNQSEALAMADRIAVMKEGVIEQCDHPKVIYEKPRTHFVADFIGSMNFFTSRVVQSNREVTTLDIPGSGQVRLTAVEEQKVGDEVLFCIRPERMRISLLPPKEYENGIRGVLLQKSYLGEVTKFLLELPEKKRVSVIVQNYLLQLSNEFYDIGEQVYLIWSQTSGKVIHG